MRKHIISLQNPSNNRNHDTLQHLSQLHLMPQVRLLRGESFAAKHRCFVAAGAVAVE
jgi:hypothetical protein